MRNFSGLFTFVFLTLSLQATAQSIFLPENGHYVYGHSDIERSFDRHGQKYIFLKDSAFNSSLRYKLDSQRNEYQVKDWFAKDWFLMQDQFFFDAASYIKFHKGSDFNEAKRKEYSRFLFNKRKFFHKKSSPAMKEWGGLTHPPIKKLIYPLSFYGRDFSKKDYLTVESPFFSPHLQLEIDRVSRSELSFSNTLKPLADREAFIMKKRLISGANKSILMSSLVFVCDIGTKQIINLLIKKHREGIGIKIMTDGFLGKILKHRECLQRLRTEGIEVLETKDFFKHKGKAIYHTKTLIVDMNEAIAGGHNMIDADNLSRGTDFKNRDVDLYVKGPMVTDIARQFTENWRYQTRFFKNLAPLVEIEGQIRQKILQEKRDHLRGAGLYQKILLNKKSRMKGVCRFIKQAPYEDRHSIGKAYLKLLDRTKEHLIINDPVKIDTFVKYPLMAPLLDKLDNFEMFNLLHNKVQDLARKGLKLDYITTNINMAGNENVAIMIERIKEQLDDGKELLANWSFAKLVLSNSFFGRPHYENLMKDWLPFNNVHIWKHISFMHSKIFYFDRIVASIGSYNFQHNATDHAYESTAICMDEELNQELDKILVEDMVNSVPLIFLRAI